MQKKIRKTIFFILIFIFLYFSYELYMSYNQLSVEFYETTSNKSENNIRIVLISDLHDHQFGDNNEALIKRIENQNPDLILMAGDMINGDTNNIEPFVTLVESLTKIARVYYALGNHEIEYANTNGMGFVTELEDIGNVNVMNGTYEDIVINEVPLRIGALYEYAFITEDDDPEKYSQRATTIYMEEFCNTDSLKLFMTHRPEAFIYSVGENANNWDIDCVLSGHIHGGQIVLPGLGGLYGAELGWFPKYADGKYNLNKTDFYVTRGLGSHVQLLPRLWNRPQIMVVDVQPR